MRHPARNVVPVVSSVFLIYLCTCGSSNPGNTDGGQNLGLDAGCTVSGLPGQGKACNVELTGAVNAGLECTNFGFASYDSPSNTTSILNIGGNYNDAGVRLVAIDLKFDGTPDAGAPNPTLIPSNGGPGPNNVTIILNDPGDTTYYASYAGPGPGQMSLTLTGAEVAMNADGGGSNLYCIHGYITADVPKLSPGAPSIVHLDAGF
jgi:hypothetical protein